MPRVCVFDVDETLLNLGALDPHFERVFGGASTRQGWFGKFLTSGKHQERNSAVCGAFLGALGRTRTCGLLIRSMRRRVSGRCP